MKVEDLEFLDREVFSNHETRKTILEAMRIAYLAKQVRSEYDTHQDTSHGPFDGYDGYTEKDLYEFDTFEEWINFVKRKLDK